MARLGINTGSIANDGTGDTLRAAGAKINDNFLELYTYLGSGSTTILGAPMWKSTNVGINTTSNVGIGTTNPRFTLEVGSVGASGTTLYVNGDARITGIVTIGTSSITLNGSTNRITVGSGVTIDGSTGIISATSVVLGGTTITGAGVTYITAGSGISVNQNTGNVTITATGGGGGGESYWASTTAGIHTTSKVGVGTTNPSNTLTVKGNTSLETLNVSGISTFTGNVSVGSSVTYTSGNAAVFTAPARPSLSIYQSTSTNEAFLEYAGTDLNIRSYGSTYIWSDADGSAAFPLVADSSGSAQLYFGTNKKLETLGAGVTVTGTTFTNQLNVSGISTFNGKVRVNNSNILLGDGSEVAGNQIKLGNGNSTDAFGDTSDLWIYHNPSYGNLLQDITGTGVRIWTPDFQLKSSDSTKSMILALQNAGVELYYANSKKFETLGAGVTVTGTTFTNQLNVSGVSTLGTVQISSGIITASSGIVTYYGDASNATDGRWTLGANGTSDYTFTGIGFTQTTNDPVLYLTRGKVYEFVNNSGGSHPFEIRLSNGGSAYNTGVTNNGSASGTIRFEVPFNAPNTLYYQCTNHSGMGSTIFVTPRNEPAVGVRTTVTGTTGSIGIGSTTNLNIDGFKSYGLLKVGISSAAWVVLYTDASSRTSDESRSYLTDPTPGSGVLAEVRTTTTGISTFLMSPGIIGWNNDVSVASTIYARVTNNESSTVTGGISVTLTVVKLED